MKMRLENIDIVRGLVMVIMALDHTRDILHSTALTHQPTDLNTTNYFLFFTRWITHLCAPTFVFLAGASAYLLFQKKRNMPATRKYLFTRGLWLIFLDFTVISFGLWMDIHFNTFLFNVVATIGFGFIILSFLLHLSPKKLAIIGGLILCLHNLFPMLPIASIPVAQALSGLFSPTAFPILGSKIFIMGYPPIPWLGLMLLGFGMGKIFEEDFSSSKRKFLTYGLLLILGFIVLRAINIYGDAQPWTLQARSGFSFLSFINLTKYPPSLQFCLLFIGLLSLIFYCIGERRNYLTQFLQVYGKVALFYFIVHWYIIHLLLMTISLVQGYGFKDMQFGSNFGRPKDWSGLDLISVYVVWLVVIITMYPLCKWYGRYKESNSQNTLLQYL